MANSDHKSPGGGSNYLCLPTDPKYDSHAPTNTPWSALGRVWYQTDQHRGAFPTESYKHLVPCAVCEADQRVTEVMVPAAVRCLNSNWVLEYKGYIMAALTNDLDKSYIKDIYYKTSYICVDQKAESLTSKPNTEWSGCRFSLSRRSALVMAHLVIVPHINQTWLYLVLFARSDVFSNNELFFHSSKVF